jgi:hypothetical protein
MPQQWHNPAKRRRRNILVYQESLKKINYSFKKNFFFDKLFLCFLNLFKKEDEFERISIRYCR